MKGNGCPSCSGRRVSGDDNLETFAPEIAKQWHPQKNGRLNPKDVTSSSNKDEAHLLQTGPLEELRLLTNFKMDSYDPFILVLSGQSDLRRTMEFAVMGPFNQRVAIRYHMPGLGPDETKNYVTHHLKLAGA
jgi:hypothetical protein